MLLFFNRWTRALELGLQSSVWVEELVYWQWMLDCVVWMFVIHCIMPFRVTWRMDTVLAKTAILDIPGCSCTHMVSLSTPVNQQDEQLSLVLSEFQSVDLCANAQTRMTQDNVTEMIILCLCLQCHAFPVHLLIKEKFQLPSPFMQIIPQVRCVHWTVKDKMCWIYSVTVTVIPVVHKDIIPMACN